MMFHVGVVISPVVLQNASNFILPERFCNVPAFLLSQSNPSKGFIDSEFSVEVACVYDIIVNSLIRIMAREMIPCEIISTGFPNALQVFP